MVTLSPPHPHPSPLVLWLLGGSSRCEAPAGDGTLVETGVGAFLPLLPSDSRPAGCRFQLSWDGSAFDPPLTAPLFRPLLLLIFAIHCQFPELFPHSVHRPLTRLSSRNPVNVPLTLPCQDPAWCREREQSLEGGRSRGPDLHLGCLAFLVPPTFPGNSYSAFKVPPPALLPPGSPP